MSSVLLWGLRIPVGANMGVVQQFQAQTKGSYEGSYSKCQISGLQKRLELRDLKLRIGAYVLVLSLNLLVEKQGDDYVPANTVDDSQLTFGLYPQAEKRDTGALPERIEINVSGFLLKSINPSKKPLSIENSSLFLHPLADAHRSELVRPATLIQVRGVYDENKSNDKGEDQSKSKGKGEDQSKSKGKRKDHGKDKEKKKDRDQMAVSLDLSSSANPQLIVHEGALRADIATLIKGEAHFGIEHESLRFSMGLNSVQPRLSVLFKPTDSAKSLLPLNVTLAEAKKDRILVPIAIAKYYLCVQMNQLLPVQQIAVISGLQAQPAEEELTFYFFGYANKQNNPSSFRCASRVDLSICADPGGIGTLLIDDKYNGRNALALRVPPESSVLHGTSPGCRWSLAERIHLHCTGSRQPPKNVQERIAANLQREFTLPFLGVTSGAAGRPLALEVAKPGHSYVKGALPSTTLTKVATYAFSATEAYLPLLGTLAKKQLSTQAVTDFQNKLKAAANNLTYQFPPVVIHESRFLERPHETQKELRLDKNFISKLASGLPDVIADLKPELPDHKLIKDFGPFQFETLLPQAKLPESYVFEAVDKNGITEQPEPLDLSLSGELIKFSLLPMSKWIAGRPKDWPVAVLKIGQKETLKEILDRYCKKKEIDLNGYLLGAPVIEDGSKLGFFDDLDPLLNESSWTGVIFFFLPVLGQGQKLSSVIPNNGLWLTYLAISPARKHEDGKPQVSTNARLLCRPKVLDAKLSAQEEISVQVLNVDGRWRDNRVTQFNVDTAVSFHSFLGASTDPAKPPTLKISTSYDPEHGQLRFSGNLDLSLSIHKSISFGPFASVEIQSVDMKLGSQGFGIDLKGAVTLSKNLGSIESNIKDKIGWSGIGFSFPEKLSTDAIPTLKIDYSRFKLDVAVPLFKLGSLEMNLQSIGVFLNDFNSSRTASLPLDGQHSTPPDLSNVSRGIRVALAMNLMKLPELASKALQGFTLVWDVELGLSQNGGGWKFDPALWRISLRSATVESLDLDLLRFLRIRAKKIGVTSNPLRLGINELSIDVLGHNLIRGLSGCFIQDKPARFLLTYVKGQTAGQPVSGIIDIDYLLIGHNIGIEDAVAKLLLAPERDKAKDQQDQISKALTGLIGAQVGTASQAVAQNLLDGWLIAAGIQFWGGALIGKVVFQDKKYYGISLSGDLFESILGADITISVLYLRGAVAEADAFHIAVGIPPINFTGIRFTGGIVELDLGLNGDFSFDLGFPRLRNGTREWNRALGAIVTIGQASGGLYFGSRHELTAGNSKDLLCVAGGYALQGGLGISGGFGPFEVWATIGFYAILEGQITLERKGRAFKPQTFTLTGAIGVVGSAAVSADLWIISIRLTLMISAEARGSVTLDVSGSDPVLVLSLAFEVAVEVNARACIGAGPFKLCKSLTLHESLHIGHTLRLSA